MSITLLSSNEQALRELGERLRAARIDTPLTQAELATRAGVSLSSVASLERGGDVRLSTLLSMLRALGMLENADALVPRTETRPTQIAKLGRARKRAPSSRKVQDAPGTWTWGDEP